MKITREFEGATPEGRQMVEHCSSMSTGQEIIEEWKKVKEKAPGKDNIRIIYLNSAPLAFQENM